MKVLPEIQFQISLLNLVHMGEPEPQTQELEKLLQSRDLRERSAPLS